MALARPLRAPTHRFRSIWSQRSSTGINVYLVPYLDEKSPGNARSKDRRIFVGVWSDKASKARKSPERFQLIESEPFREGSPNRTMAHEFGHVLGLRHPDKSTQTVLSRLMGGRKAGYDLTLAEIETARESARKFDDGR